MKKILLASSALAMLAGVAAADVDLSGSAEMGIFGADSDVGDAPTQFHTDLDVNFKMSGATDTGIEFGASIDLDEGGDGSAFEAPETQGGESIYVKKGAVKVSMGDVNGALDGYFKEYIGAVPGSIQDNEETAPFGTSLDGAEVLDDGLDGFYDGQIAAVDVKLDAISFGVSVELDDTDEDGGEPVYGIGAKFSPELGGLDLTIGAGYQTVEDAAGDNVSVYGVSAEAGLEGGIDIVVSYGYVDSEITDDTAYGLGLSVGFSIDEISLGLSYAMTDIDEADTQTTGYSITAGYDLGGGLALQAGYGYSDIEVGTASVDVSTYSLGLAMSF